MKRGSAFLAVATSILLGACGTPQVALDQAKQSVELIDRLTAELARYDRNTKISATRRLAAVQDDKDHVSMVSTEGRLSEFMLSSSGYEGRVAAQTLLRKTADEYGRLVDQREKDRVELAERMKTLLKAVPSPAEKLGIVQKAMAEMGTQLSPAERLKIVTTFLSEAKDLADKNGEKADGAAASGATGN
jgi:hypothetical protein